MAYNYSAVPTEVISSQYNPIMASDHVLLAPPPCVAPSAKGTKRKRESQNKYSAEVKAQVVSDTIKLGPTEAVRRMSTLLGHTIPESTARTWKKNYFNQLNEAPIHEIRHESLPKKPGMDSHMTKSYLTQGLTIDDSCVSNNNVQMSNCIVEYDLPAFDFPWLSTASNTELQSEMKGISVDHGLLGKDTNFQKASRSYNRYTVEFKTQVAADAARLGPAEAGRHWSVPKSTVSDWKKIYVTKLKDGQVEEMQDNCQQEVMRNTEVDDVYHTHVPIENCPRCCTVLVPVQFTVNVLSAVMKTMCQCGLNIEIDPKPSLYKKQH